MLACSCSGVLELARVVFIKIWIGNPLRGVIHHFALTCSHPSVLEQARSAFISQVRGTIIYGQRNRRNRRGGLRADRGYKRLQRSDESRSRFNVMVRGEGDISRGGRESTSLAPSMSTIGITFSMTLRGGQARGRGSGGIRPGTFAAASHMVP